jgi:hypothetical protein
MVSVREVPAREISNTADGRGNSLCRGKRRAVRRWDRGRARDAEPRPGRRDAIARMLTVCGPGRPRRVIFLEREEEPPRWERWGGPPQFRIVKDMQEGDGRR